MESRDMGDEGSSSTEGEGNSSIFWVDNQEPVVMVWDGILPGEQESAKKIITDEDDWIIWRVKSPRDDSRGRVGTDRQSQEITDFLERHGTRLEGIKLKGTNRWEKLKINYRLARKPCTDFNTFALCKMTICHQERLFTVSPPAPSTCDGCPPKRTIL
jgi:hypothetical protein